MFRVLSFDWQKTSSRRSVKAGGTVLVRNTPCHATRYQARQSVSRAFQNRPARYFLLFNNVPCFLLLWSCPQFKIFHESESHVVMA